MKTKNIFSAAFVVLLAVIFTSCSTSVDIAKRQFNNGYYVHIASKKQTNAPVNELVQDKKEMQLIVVNPVISGSRNLQAIDQPVVQEKVLPDGNVVVASTEKNNTASSKKYLKEIATISEEVAELDNNKIEYPADRYKTKNLYRNPEMKLRDTYVPGIIILILCILIPPLAILLDEDGTGKAFWLDLLFWLIGWGGVVNPIAFLFWLIAIIYAISVCF